MSPRGARRSVRALLVALFLLVVGAVHAPAASAATIDCPRMGTDVCNDIRPVAECVWDNRDGTMTALWGWSNATADTARIPAGAQNRMSPGDRNQGQPVLFGPGTQRNVFTTTFSGTSASWRLGNESADVSASGTPRCATKPVPQVGNVGALLLGIALLSFGALLVLTARPRRVAVPA